MKLAKKWRVPLVISALGTIERKVAYEGSYTSKQIIEAMNFADKILSVSEDLKLHIVNLGINEEKVHGCNRNGHMQSSTSLKIKVRSLRDNVVY